MLNKYLKDYLQPKRYNIYIYITGFSRMTDIEDSRAYIRRRNKLFLFTLTLTVLYFWFFFFYITETFDLNYAYNLHRWSE